MYDIETRTYGKPDPSKDNLRIFACYSYKTKKVYLLTKKEDIQKIINSHKYLVGFNNQGTRMEPGYDNQVLLREGINLQYKIMIDLRNIFKQRASQMKIEKGMLGDLLMEYSLDFISKTIGIVDEHTGKIDIDYKKFQKEVWTKEEVKEIGEYAKRDIFVTKKLYEWVEEYFSVFKPFLDLEDIRKKKYLTLTIAGFAYRAICKAMSWSPDTGSIGGADRIKGGYISYPAGDRFEGNIYLFDYASLYPHIMIQCNLYGRKKKIVVGDAVWKGGGKWNVEGTYASDKLSGVCELFKKWYADRVVYKKAGDKREYTLKICLNAAYGISDNPYYIRTFDSIAAGDCTGIGRQWALYARKLFRENGYKIIYSDTDSCFIRDPFNDMKKMMDVKDKIINDIKVTVPFPQNTFDMDIDDEIKYIFFFKSTAKKEEAKEEEMDEDDYKNKGLGLMKKNYIYVTPKNKVIIKNLGIKKKSTSALVRKIFWEYLVPQIKEGNVSFKKSYLKRLITELLEKDITLATLRKEVGNFEQYREKSPTSLPGQIAKKFGSGIYFLIPNLKGIGVGKSKKYCTLEEFKKNEMRIEHIDLSNIWKELAYFIKASITKNIFEYGG